MKGLEETHVQSYYEYMIEVAVLLGVDRDYAMEELRKSLDFEIELAMVCKTLLYLESVLDINSPYE